MFVYIFEHTDTLGVLIWWDSVLWWFCFLFSLIIKTDILSLNCKTVFRTKTIKKCQYLTVSLPVVISKVKWLYPCIINSVKINSWSPCVLRHHFTALVSHCQRSSPGLHTQLFKKNIWYNATKTMLWFELHRYCCIISTDRVQTEPLSFHPCEKIQLQKKRLKSKL